MNILFNGHNWLLDPLIESLAKEHNVFVFHNAKVKRPTISGATVIPVLYSLLGFPTILQKARSQITTPTYIKHFTENVSQAAPGVIVVMDFFKFSFVQAIRYVRRHRECKLYLYSETKAWPKNTLTRGVMKLFWWYLQKNQTAVHKVLVYTRQGETFFKEHLPGVPVEVHAPGIDASIFVPDPKKEYMPEGRLRILINARFTEYKNHTDVFDAVRILHDKGYALSVTCIGRGGNTKDALKEYVDEIGIHDLVHFSDFEPSIDFFRIVPVYHAHDVVVLPSRNEAIGMAIPEAMACGIPTITSDTVGANVYVEEGVTGLIFTTGDVADLAQVLEQMLDAERVRSMGLNARERIEEYFTREHVGEQFRVTMLQ